MNFSLTNRCLSVAALGAIFLSPLTAQAPSALEQRIRRIQDGIIQFPVVTKGEPASRVSLASRMAALHVPGVSIAVIHEGKIEWARGFGVTLTGGPPVTPETLFQAGSISKPLAALAALRLVQSGKLDLDTDINQYLKTWKVPENSFTAQTKVTLRGLLTHTAGIAVIDFPGYASGAALPSVQQVLNGEKPANTPPIRVDSKPGTIWQYSNGGYVVAQLMLQDVTGVPFAKLMHDTVLSPIGMTRSTYEQPLPKGRLAEVATPYRPDGQPVPGGPHVHPEMAPAGLWTTPSDLARYAIEVQRTLAGTSDRVLSGAMARQMLTPGLHHSRITQGFGHELGQGLGPRLGGSAERPYFTHTGSNEGYSNLLLAYNNGDGVVVMTNSDGGEDLRIEILRTVAHEYGWPDFQPVEHTVIRVDPKLLDGYVGSYQLNPRTTFEITREGDQLFVELTGQPKLPAFPESDRQFFSKVEEAQIEFEVDSQGRATGLIVHANGGMELRARRRNDAEAKQMADEAAAKAAAIAKRVKEQKAAPGSEAALRRGIEDLRRGEPDYSQMSAGFAEETRRRLPGLKEIIAKLGAVQSVTFKRVDPDGHDAYEVKFENGLTAWRIGMTPDGRIEGVGFRRM